MTGSAEGPIVVIAHGFAGSRQMMLGYAQPLAKAGYQVYTFDFEGHGHNPAPMSGDVTAIDGTTRLLVNQTLEVIRTVVVPSESTALLGHSMATNIVIRAAGQENIGPVVALSPFSQAVTADTPRDLLMISGK